jgi:hypothetical protein
MQHIYKKCIYMYILSLIDLSEQYHIEGKEVHFKQNILTIVKLVCL